MGWFTRRPTKLDRQLAAIALRNKYNKAARRKANRARHKKLKTWWPSLYK